MSESTAAGVALTFDAEHPDRPWCPPGNADAILDTLADRAVPRHVLRAGPLGGGATRRPRARIADGRSPRRPPLPLPRPHAAARSAAASTTIARRRTPRSRRPPASTRTRGSGARSAPAHDDPGCSPCSSARLPQRRTGTWSSRTGSRGGPARRSPPTRSRASARTATARWCCSTPGPAGPPTAIGPMIDGLRELGRHVRDGRRARGAAVTDGPRCWPSTAAARRSTPRSCAATAPSWAPLGSHGEIDDERAATWGTSRIEPSRVPPRRRAPSARARPGSPPVADVGGVLPRGRGPPADDRRHRALAARDGWVTEPMSCATTRSPCSAPGPTGRGGWASSAGSGQLRGRRRPTAASRGSPPSGPISGDWGGGTTSGARQLWYAIRAEDGRGREDGPANARCPRTSGSATPAAAWRRSTSAGCDEERLAELAPAGVPSGRRRATRSPGRSSTVRPTRWSPWRPPRSAAPHDESSTSTSCWAAASSATTTSGSSRGSATGSRVRAAATVRRLDGPADDRRGPDRAWIASARDEGRARAARAA